MKRCVTCGMQQERWRDKGGREKTNIDPISGKCIDCLAKDKGVKPDESQPFDAKQAAANDSE